MPALERLTHEVGEYQRLPRGIPREPAGTVDERGDELAGSTARPDLHRRTTDRAVRVRVERTR
jgi:hypothetical protein